VKELLKPKKDTKKKRTRHELYQGIDADYYGFRDEDDGVLLELEAAAQKKRSVEVCLCS
jgi:pre-mRNA-splicing factor ISY1